jgi:uncharacterized protein YoxC
LSKLQQVGQNFLTPTQQIEQAKNCTKAATTNYEQLQDDCEKLLEKCNSLLVDIIDITNKFMNSLAF